MKKILLLSILFVFSCSIVHSQKNLWEKTTKEQLTLHLKVERASTINKFDVYQLNLTSLKANLINTPERGNNVDSNIIMSFPNSNGILVDFKIYEAPIMHEDLLAQNPNIKSYVGVGVSDKSTSIRFSTTIFGFHGMIFSPSGTTLIDPYTKDLNSYIVYNKNQAQSNRVFECLVEDIKEDASNGVNFSPKNSNNTQANSGLFRTYRLALASTEEYSAFHIAQAGVGAGSLVVRENAVLSAMNVTMTRINGIFERDMSMRLVIIPNNTNIIFLLPEKPDTLSNNDGGALINEIQGIVDANVGPTSYDIGHVFSTGGGGIAQLNSPCSGNKARGVTGSGAPVGDSFDIDYVAHEMGHQFGATHTQNNSCQRSAATSVEPGSASTIMGYAGICSPNVQNFSDTYFHVVSLAQMDAFVSGGGNCSVNIQNNNTAPVITPILNYNIPISTPFILKGNGTDANGDSLTYCWEQTNTDIATQPPATTNTGGPTFRSYSPTTSTDRYLPEIFSILNGSNNSTWEVLPSVARTMNFALTIRDNRTPNGGQTARANMTVTTMSGTTPFQVTAPNSNVNWNVGSVQTVTWDVGGTTENGVNTASVDIYLSTNNGTTFPVLLASQVPNDGSEAISIPNLVGSGNRIMVMGHKNIFFDISNSNFTISAAPSATMYVTFNGVGEQTKSACKGDVATFTGSYQTISGFSGNTTFSVTGQPAGTTVTFNPTTLNATATFTLQVSNTTNATAGLHTMVVTATSGTIVKTTNFYLNLADGNFSSVALSTPTNGSSVSPGNVNFTWAASTNATGYDIQVATNATFLNVILTGSSATTSFSTSALPSASTLYWRIRPKNTSCNGVYSTNFSLITTFCGTTASTDVPVIISASGTPTIISTITIPANQNITITDINVNVNITHTWINDLIVTLISPTGTQVILMNNECSPTTSINNVLATFDDSGVAVVCGNNPGISGTVLPEQALTAFNGQASQGIWTLQIQDVFNQDGGSLNAWSLNICSNQAPLSVIDNNLFNFVVYPNPNNGSFNVQLSNLISENVSVKVYDMRGRTIYQTSFNNNGAFNEMIRLNNAEAGVYLMSVTDGDRTEVKRIIVK